MAQGSFLVVLLPQEVRKNDYKKNMGVIWAFVLFALLSYILIASKIASYNYFHASLKITFPVYFTLWVYILIWFGSIKSSKIYKLELTSPRALTNLKVLGQGCKNMITFLTPKSPDFQSFLVSP